MFKSNNNKLQFILSPLPSQFSILMWLLLLLLLARLSIRLFKTKQKWDDSLSAFSSILSLAEDFVIVVTRITNGRDECAAPQRLLYTAHHQRQQQQHRSGGENTVYNYITKWRRMKERNSRIMKPLKKSRRDCKTRRLLDSAGSSGPFFSISNCIFNSLEGSSRV